MYQGAHEQFGVDSPLRIGGALRFHQFAEHVDDAALLRPAPRVSALPWLQRVSSGGNGRPRFVLRSFGCSISYGRAFSSSHNSGWSPSRLSRSSATATNGGDSSIA